MNLWVTSKNVTGDINFTWRSLVSLGDHARKPCPWLTVLGFLIKMMCSINILSVVGYLETVGSLFVYMFDIGLIASASRDTDVIYVIIYYR